MRPQKALLSDTNDRLINALTYVRDEYEEVFGALHEFSPTEPDYYDIRRRYNAGEFTERRRNALERSVD